MWPPPYVPFSDVEFDAWTDEVSVGTFDDGFIPARLPGRRNHFQSVTAHLPRRGPASPSDAPHGKRGGVPSASSRPVAPLTSDDVPWSRDAA